MNRNHIKAKVTDIPLRDQIANVAWLHWLAGLDNYDNAAIDAPTVRADDDSYVLADALLERFDISLRSPHPTPEKP